MYAEGSVVWILICASMALSASTHVITAKTQQSPLRHAEMLAPDEQLGGQASGGLRTKCRNAGKPNATRRHRGGNPPTVTWVHSPIMLATAFATQVSRGFATLTAGQAIIERQDRL